MPMLCLIVAGVAAERLGIGAQEIAKAVQETAKAVQEIAIAASAVSDVLDHPSAHINPMNKSGVETEWALPQISRPPVQSVPKPLIPTGVSSIVRTLFGDTSYTDVVATRLSEMPNRATEPTLWLELAIAYSELGNRTTEVEAALKMAHRFEASVDSGAFQYSMALALASAGSNEALSWAKKAESNNVKGARTLIRAIVYESVNDRVY